MNKIVQWVEVLRTKDDLDQIKTKVLFEIMEALVVSVRPLTSLEPQELTASGGQQEDHEDRSKEGFPIESYLSEAPKDIAS